ncbi:MAG: hypothetical protein N3A65_07700 [candidate division WOR-3 bacterium]|nr:hypothetical protein [candidate division WOR-3 bacterium]
MMVVITKKISFLNSKDEGEVITLFDPGTRHTCVHPHLAESWIKQKPFKYLDVQIF